MLSSTSTLLYPLFSYISFPFLFSLLLLLQKNIKKKESKNLVNNTSGLLFQTQQKVSINSAEVSREGMA